MFQFQTLCPARTAPAGAPPRRERAALFAIEPGLIGRRTLAAAAALSVFAGIATLPRPNALPSPAEAVPTRDIVLHAPDVVALRDRAEAMRMELLARPGVRDVRIEGLRQLRYMVAYDPRRLASLGIRPADLAASLPVDEAASRPGLIALRADARVAGFQAAADMQVTVGTKAFRLGDIAGVQRMPLQPPLSTFQLEGQPAARLRVISAP